MKIKLIIEYEREPNQKIISIVKSFFNELSSSKVFEYEVSKTRQSIKDLGIKEVAYDNELTNEQKRILNKFKIVEDKFQDYENISFLLKKLPILRSTYSTKILSEEYRYETDKRPVLSEKDQQSIKNQQNLLNEKERIKNEFIDKFPFFVDLKDEVRSFLDSEDNIFNYKLMESAIHLAVKGYSFGSYNINDYSSGVRIVLNRKVTQKELIKWIKDHISEIKRVQKVTHSVKNTTNTYLDHELHRYICLFRRVKDIKLTFIKIWLKINVVLNQKSYNYKDLQTRYYSSIFNVKKSSMKK